MKGEGDTEAQGHNNSIGYSSNPWKNAFLEFQYVLVFMCLCCRMLPVVAACLEFTHRFSLGTFWPAVIVNL